jgi:hypothetical protein
MYSGNQGMRLATWFKVYILYTDVYSGRVGKETKGVGFAISAG